MFERRSLASLLMLVGFSACFVMQVWDQVLKFLGEETVTVAKYQEDELRLVKAHNGTISLLSKQVFLKPQQISCDHSLPHGWHYDHSHGQPCIFL